MGGYGGGYNEDRDVGGYGHGGYNDRGFGGQRDFDLQGPQKKRKDPKGSGREVSTPKPAVKTTVKKKKEKVETPQRTKIDAIETAKALGYSNPYAGYDNVGAEDE